MGFQAGKPWLLTVMLKQRRMRARLMRLVLTQAFGSLPDAPNGAAQVKPAPLHLPAGPTRVSASRSGATSCHALRLRHSAGPAAFTQPSPRIGRTAAFADSRPARRRQTEERQARIGTCLSSCCAAARNSPGKSPGLSVSAAPSHRSRGAISRPAALSRTGPVYTLRPWWATSLYPTPRMDSI
ncbi:hypothetical protein ABH899_001119 [Paenibacillus sp. RC84]